MRAKLRTRLLGKGAVEDAVFEVHARHASEDEEDLPGCRVSMRHLGLACRDQLFDHSDSIIFMQTPSIASISPMVVGSRGPIRDRRHGNQPFRAGRTMLVVSVNSNGR